MKELRGAWTLSCVKRVSISALEITMSSTSALRQEIKPVMICPGHGPVLDSDLEDLYAKYEEWCGTVQANQPQKVVIPYVSAYGYTAQLA